VKRRRKEWRPVEHNDTNLVLEHRHR